MSPRSTVVSDLFRECELLRRASADAMAFVFEDEADEGGVCALVLMFGVGDND